MANQVKVSVVIPIYNVEKYLRQCLDSVVNQTLRDIEIICVNDGSKDSSPDIINEYASRDPRIVVINKPNSGYGHSMNCGFDKATGEYIGIVESDDYADPDMFEKLYDCAKADELDVVKSGFYFYWSNPEERSVPNPICSEVMSRRIICPTRDFKAPLEAVEFFNIKPTIWSAIYRKDFIRGNNIRFNETPGASYQDASFNFKVWACAERIKLMRECFLHYRQDNEASSINSPGKVYCICDEYAEMERFIETQPLKKAFLAPVCARLRYDSYFWNYYRLNEILAGEFMSRFHDDFVRLNDEGLLQHKYFEWYRWIELCRIIDDSAAATHKRHSREKQGVREPLPPPVMGRKSSYVIRNMKRGYRCLRVNGFRYTLLRILEKAANKLR